MIKLSVLVLSVPNRLRFFYPRIMKQLIDQTKNRTDVELLALFDNKKRSLGMKRQALLDLAQGEYCVFIDDDDRISDDYISEIMNALYNNSNCDCVVFDTEMRINNGQPIIVKCDAEFKYGYVDNNNHSLGFRCKPAHIMVYKTSIAKAHKYNDMNRAEDVDWGERACLDIKHQVRIDKVLYFYDASPATTSEVNNSFSLSDENIQQHIDNLINNCK